MHRPFVAVLSSGSCGNSMLCQSEEASIMIDAGISCRELERRLSAFGVDADDVDAVLLTHEHTDHNRGARRFCRLHKVSLFATEGTLALSSLDGVDATPIRRHGEFKIEDLRIRAFPVLHLAAEPVGFAISMNGRKLSIASDLGCLTKSVAKEMRGSDLVMVEANYDDDMLMNGSYPDFLKKAIAGDHGHLSNADAARLCAEVIQGSTKQIVLLHLSKDNNTTDLATEEVENAVKKRGLSRPSVSTTEHGCQNGPFVL